MSSHPAMYGGLAARNYAAKSARMTKMVDLELVCRECGTVYHKRVAEDAVGRVGRYCPRHSGHRAASRRQRAKKAEEATNAPA